MRHALAMARRSTAEIPADLRARLERARLDLLALFRALDKMDLSPAETPNALSANCLSWMPILWKLSGRWTNRLADSISTP